MRSIHYIILVITSLLAICIFKGQAQVAGIKVNGVFIATGDTVRVCASSNIIYSYAYTGTVTISWTFTGGPPSSSLQQVTVSYSNNGVFITRQKISSGNVTDSSYILLGS